MVVLGSIKTVCHSLFFKKINNRHFEVYTTLLWVWDGVVVKALRY